MLLRSNRNDRRFDDRHPGTGMVATIDGVEYEVLDISIGGMKVPPPQGMKLLKGLEISFVLSSSRWPEMKVANGLGEVRAITKDWIALQFVRPSYDLMKSVSRHVAGLVWGDKPYGY